MPCKLNNNNKTKKKSLTFKLKIVFSVLCFFFEPVPCYLLLYSYRNINFDTHISKEHSPNKSRVPCAPFILWAPAPPKVSARPCGHWHCLKWPLIAIQFESTIQPFNQSSLGAYICRLLTAQSLLFFWEWRTSTTLNCSNMLVEEQLEDV